MFELNKERYKRIFFEYVSRFSDFYPNVVCWCGNIHFSVNGHTWKYSELTGVSVSSDYLILEVETKYCIYLPIFGEAFYHIGELNECMSD